MLISCGEKCLYPVSDAEPTLNKHCFTVLCTLGMCVETRLTTDVSRPDEQHNIDYRCSADPMRFNVGPASATLDQYCIGIGSTHRGCWVDLKPCGIMILMVTEYHPPSVHMQWGDVL